MQIPPSANPIFNPSRRLPEEAVNVMLAWYREHRDWAYPTEEERDEMREQTGLSKMQIDNWFINKRRRDKSFRRRADDDGDEQPAASRAPASLEPSEPTERSLRYALRPARSAAFLSTSPPPPQTRRPAERPPRASASAPRITPAQSYTNVSHDYTSPYSISYPDPYIADSPSFADPPPSQAEYVSYSAVYGAPASTPYFQEQEMPHSSRYGAQPVYVGYGSLYPSFPGQQPPAPRQGEPYGDWPYNGQGYTRYH